MKNKQKFEVAYIATGVYRTPGYKSKEYSTLGGFKRGLIANGCPYKVDSNGLFYDVDGGKLKRRQWNKHGISYTATIELK